MKTSEVAERLNKDPNDQKARKALARILGGYCALRIDDAGKILAAETDEAIEYCEESGLDAPDAITFAAWEAQSAKQREACPVTRRALLNGKLRIERPHGLPAVSVDWGPIPEDVRLIAAYRAETDGLSDPVVAAAALSGSLPFEWAQAQRDWRDLLALPKPTAQQRALIERVRARLVFQREPVAELALRPDYSPQPSAAPIGSAVPVLIMYHGRDARVCLEIMTAAVMLERQGLVRFLSWEPPAGKVSANWRAQQLCTARLVVPLISADAIADQTFSDALNAVIYQGTRLLPVIVRSVYLAGHPITKQRGRDLTGGDTVIDVVSAMREIATALASVPPPAAPAPVNTDQSCQADAAPGQFIGCPDERGTCARTGQRGKCGRIVK